MSHNAAEFNRKFLAALAVLLVLLSFAYVFTITLIPIGKDAVQFANITLGFILGTVIGSVCGFFFGNSKQRESANTLPIAPDAPVPPATATNGTLTP